MICGKKLRLLSLLHCLVVRRLRLVSTLVQFLSHVVIPLPMAAILGTAHLVQFQWQRNA
ncbi:hypothetical protein BVC80_7225g2 [Macleaya cordata]|uniref:Uncharacterized protein n=1 Tax=Macleaya cordata TaxID=56857 RepID=A0A200PXX4_MACCD|nr:hypothetical protein BVC80_7225g2 [Macleaya cordata]